MNEIKEIKNLISNRAYGIKTKKGIRPSANKTFLKNGFKRPPSNKIILAHTENKETLYYFGNESSNYTVVMIDIDVNKKNKKGSKKGAIEFAKYINKNLFKTYYEPSTNGEGIHAYFIVDKQGCSSKEFNNIIKNFQNYLQNIAEKINADIELVEVKGTLFEIEYEKEKIKEIKYGMLGKIPRDIRRFFKYKTIINIQKIKEEFNLEKIKKRKQGSISEKHFTQEKLSKLDCYRKIASELIGDKAIKAGKFAIIVEDIAIAIMFLKFLKENKNNDNTLPTKRIECLWKAVYKAGDITRGWNHHRWKGIRDLLSNMGLIKWIDNRYQITDKINKTEGIACKWEISEKLYMYIQKSEKVEGSSLMDTSVSGGSNLTKKTNHLCEKKIILSVLFPKIEQIIHEYSHKIPILSLISIKDKNLFFEKAYNYIGSKFCVA